MSGETFAFAGGFYLKYLLKHFTQRMLGHSIPLSIFTDYKFLFRIIVKSCTTTERRLLSDLQVPLEAYIAQAIKDAGWV